jgi:centromeric protein E
MEIYNEQINDLLDPNNVNLKIREDPSEGYFVSGLKCYRINDLSDALKILALGERSRHYRQTDIHEHSSRSHTIFRILIENRSRENARVVFDDPPIISGEEIH